MITIKQKLQELDGVGPGFDALRVSLATLIFGFHCVTTSHGEAFIGPQNPIVAAFVFCLLPLFFGLSGFLVTGSALRVNSITKFLSLRFLRIAPALVTEIVISSLLIGLTVTSLSPAAYLIDPLFFSYFGSIIGRVRFILPGVFANNPIPDLVNVTLWTIPPEICCYIVTALTILYGAYKNRYAMAAFTAALIVLNIWIDITSITPSGAVVSARTLVVCFFIGNLTYLWRDRIWYDLRLFVMCSCVGIALISIQLTYSIRPGLQYLAFPLLTYALVYLGLCQLPKLPFFSGGDYSYGIYLYGFPLQQTAVHFIPSAREWYIVAAVAFPITLLAAFGSWHLIEHPFLRLRRKLKGSPRVDSLLTANFVISAALGFGLITYIVLLARWGGVMTMSLTNIGKAAIAFVIATLAILATLFSQRRVVTSGKIPAEKTTL